jgi:hypothetical protein
MAAWRRSAPGQLVQLGEDLIQRRRVEGAEGLSAVPSVDGGQLEDQRDRWRGQPVVQSGWTVTVPGKRRAARAPVKGTTNTVGNEALT